MTLEQLATIIISLPDGYFDSLIDEFTMGDPASELNSRCKTVRDVAVYAIKNYNPDGDE